MSLTAREPSSLLRPRSGHQHPTNGRLSLAAPRALVELARSRLGRKPASQWTLSRWHSRVGLRGGPQTQAKAWIPLVACSTPRTEECQAPAVGTSCDKARPTVARATLACVKGDDSRVAAPSDLGSKIASSRSRRPARSVAAGSAAEPAHDGSDAGRQSGNGSHAPFEHRPVRAKGNVEKSALVEMTWLLDPVAWSNTVQV